MIGEKLKEIRENQGMNKKEFAQYLGLKYTTYNNYETEAREPASDFLILISEKFNVSIDYLLGLKDKSEILHAYPLLADEYSHIKKYRSLNEHGKKIVDYVLEEEYRNSLKTAAVHEPNIYMVDAAHERTDIEVTEEMKNHDDDIMDDENF